MLEIRAWENMLPGDLLPQAASAVGLGGGVMLWIAEIQKALL